MMMELSKPNPVTWPADLLPRPYQLHALDRGHVVQLFLRSGSTVWATVIDRAREGGELTARVIDSTADGLRPGDEVVFTRSHVFGIV